MQLLLIPPYEVGSFLSVSFQGVELPHGGFYCVQAYKRNKERNKQKQKGINPKSRDLSQRFVIKYRSQSRSSINVEIAGVIPLEKIKKKEKITPSGINKTLFLLI